MHCFQSSPITHLEIFGHIRVNIYTSAELGTIEQCQFCQPHICPLGETCHQSAGDQFRLVILTNSDRGHRHGAGATHSNIKGSQEPHLDMYIDVDIVYIGQCQFFQTRIIPCGSTGDQFRGHRHGGGATHSNVV